MPDNFDQLSDTFTLTGAIELHQLVLKDPAQLERRKEEITTAIINATCLMTFDVGYIFEEVKQAPLPDSSSGDATVPCLHVQSLGLGAAAAEQGRRSKQGGQSRKWIYANPPLACRWKGLHRGLQEAPRKRGQAGYRWEHLSFVIIIIIMNIICTGDIPTSLQIILKLRYLKTNPNCVMKASPSTPTLTVIMSRNGIAAQHF